MSHEIWNNNIAYRGTVPWHTLGKPIPANASIEEILQLAGMDHKIERRLVRMKASKESDEMLPIPGYMAIVRDFDSHVFFVASDRYVPMQYGDMMSLFRDFVVAGDMELETAGLLKDGAVAWVLAKFTDDYKLGDEVLRPRVLIYTSHDGSLVTEAKCVEERVVCHNTLTIARSENGASFRIKHSRKDKKSAILEAKKAVGLFKAQTDKFHASAHLLAETRIQDRQQVIEYVARITNPKLLENIVEVQAAIESGNALDALIATTEFQDSKRVSESDLNRMGRLILEEIVSSPGADSAEANGTWWGALNGVTHYIDHSAGTRVSSGDNRSADIIRADNRLTSAWFGNGDKIKSTALELAVQYAEGKVN